MTKVGVIPESWRVISLGQIGKFSKGAGVRKDEANSGEIPCIRYGEIYTKHSDYIKYFYSYISETVALTSKRMKCGDILFAGSGETKEEIGKAVAFLDSIEAYAGSDMVILSPMDSNSMFLGYLLNSPLVQKQKAQKGQGDVIVHINEKQLSSIIIPYPPINEQTAIAEALSDMDALIAQTEKLIEKKKAIKQGMMQELLKPKEGWAKMRLGEYVKFQTGCPFSSAYFNTNPHGIRLIKNRDLRSDDSIVYYVGKYSDEYIVHNGDLLIGMDGDFEPVLWSKGKALLNQRVGRLIKKRDISIEFLSYILIRVLNEIQSVTGSTTVKHLSHSDVEDLEIEIPILNEQKKIGNALLEIDGNIFCLNIKLHKLKQQKAGMMQSLLTGKIRLV